MLYSCTCNSYSSKDYKNTNSIVNYTLSNNNDLRDDLLRWKEKYDSVNTEVTKAEKKLEETRQLAIQNSPDSIKKEQELNINNTALGLTDVSGQGVIVTLKDNQGVTNENIGITDDIRSYLVHDANLREIVRKLKISGAEAISINDERIVNDTSIICSGNVIRVNDKKVSSPFEIKAIGSPELLYGNLDETITRLNNSGIIVDIKKQDNVKINKYDGVINFNYAKTVE